MVSACAGSGAPTDAGRAPGTHAPSVATVQAGKDARRHVRGPCAHRGKTGEPCGLGEWVQDPVFWIALPLIAAVVVTSPLGFPHVMLR